MRLRSASTARIFGLILIALVSLWDMDAMRPHIAAHSWGTLAFVALFLVVHLSDYLTVGQLVNRIDPLVLVDIDAIAPALALRNREHEEETAGLLHVFRHPRLFLHAHASQLDWQRFLPLRQPQLSLNLSQPTAKLYTFTAVTTTVAQASGAPYPVAHQHFIVKAE